MMVALSDRILMSADEYLAWELTQQERHEYWDGAVVAMSGGTKKHNRVSSNVFKVLDRAVADRDCEVYINDIKVQVQANRKYFYRIWHPRLTGAETASAATTGRSAVLKSPLRTSESSRAAQIQ
jgi:hypothetical protein